MPDIITAPFTSEQVKLLNNFQKSQHAHPFTCGGDRTDENHLDGEGILVATEDGWVCPYCDYRQNWALSTMLLDWESYTANWSLFYL